jgi:hypothetical protein
MRKHETLKVRERMRNNKNGKESFSNYEQLVGCTRKDTTDWKYVIQFSLFDKLREETVNVCVWWGGGNPNSRDWLVAVKKMEIFFFRE